MVGDIVRTIFRTLTENEGTEITQSTLLSLQVLYRSMAQEDVMKYFTLSKFNDLKYDRHQEESMVELFAKIIYKYGEKYMFEPTSMQIPNWLRAISAMIDLRSKMVDVIPMEPRLLKDFKEAALADSH